MLEKIEGFDGRRLEAESTFSLSSIAKKNCSKCYETGRLGFINKNGKRYAILCTAKDCARDVMRAMQFAYRVQEAKKKKEEAKAKAKEQEQTDET